MIIVKEQISGLEDQVKKLFQKVLGRDKEMKIMQEKLKTWKKPPSAFIWWVPQMQIRIKWNKNILKEVMAKSLPELKKTTKTPGFKLLNRAQKEKSTTVKF